MLTEAYGVSHNYNDVSSETVPDIGGLARPERRPIVVTTDMGMLERCMYFNQMSRYK